MKNPLRPLSCIVKIKKEKPWSSSFNNSFRLIDEREKIPKTQLQKNWRVLMKNPLRPLSCIVKIKKEKPWSSSFNNSFRLIDEREKKKKGERNRERFVKRKLQ